jgi:hypothetical protein
MQFRMSQMLAVITILCILLCLIFVTPPIVAVPALFLLLVIAPAIWITGALFGGQQFRVFSIGAIASGIAFWIFSAFKAWNFAEHMFGILWYGGSLGNPWWIPAFKSELWWSNVQIAGHWISGVLGGAAALVTYRFVAPKRDPEVRLSSSNTTDGHNRITL